MTSLASKTYSEERFLHPDHLQYKQLTPEEMGIVKEQDGFYRPKQNGDWKFRATQFFTNKKPQYLWQTAFPVNGSHIRDLMNYLLQKGQSVHINTGTHGDLSGSNVCDTKKIGYASTYFLLTDIQLALRVHNVSIQVVSRDSPETRPEEANHVIDAWCFSAHKTILLFQKSISNITQNGIRFSHPYKISVTINGKERFLSKASLRDVHSNWVQVAQNEESWSFEPSKEGGLVYIKTGHTIGHLFLSAHSSNNIFIRDIRDKFSTWVHAREEDDWVKAKAYTSSQWKLMPVGNGKFYITCNGNFLTVHEGPSDKNGSERRYVHIRTEDDWVTSLCPENSQWKLTIAT